MVMLPYYYYLFIKTLYYSWDVISLPQRMAGHTIIIISILMYCLHLIWFKAIAIGVGKAFGCIKRPAKNSLEVKIQNGPKYTELPDLNNA